MLEKVPRTLVALAVLFLPTLADFHVQPAYQVTVMLEFQRGNPIHLCNGCIVYERLIATTANCVHFRFGPEGKPTMIEPSALSVWAGSSDALRKVLRVNISAINVAAGFNAETLENDLALLTLSQSLPLGERPDMRWIMLDDKVHVNHSCLVNFFSRNSKSAIPNYYQTEKLFLYDNHICRNSTAHPLARESDLCSRYVLPQQLNCQEAESFLSFNNDRGSGLVCKNSLVGLLSSVVTRPDPKNNCSDITLTAMYTNLFPHLIWIYSVMTNIETLFISTPYNASLNAFSGETATTLRDYRENEIVPTSTFQPLPQVSASVLMRTKVSQSSTTMSSAPVTEGSPSLNSTIVSPTPVIKERSLPSNGTTLFGGEDSTIAPNVTSTHSSEGIAPTLASTTALPPLSENSTDRLNSTTMAISSTLPAEDEFLEKMTADWTVSIVPPLANGNSTNELQFTNATSPTANITTTTPTLAADGVLLSNSSKISDQINSTTTANFTTSSPAPETTTSQPLVTTENVKSINSTAVNETTVVSLPSSSMPTDIPPPRKTSLSENVTGVTNATESNSPSNSTLSSTNTPPTSTTGSPVSTVVATNTTTIPPQQSTKGHNSTDTLVTEAPPPAPHSKTLPSPSSLISPAILANITADISSEEDVSNATTTANPVELYPTLESVEDSTDHKSHSSPPPRKSVSPPPTTTTTPSPTLAQMKWNHTMLRPLPTVQLEPIRESPQEAVERFFRSSATSSHFNALGLLMAFLLLQLIF